MIAESKQKKKKSPASIEASKKWRLKKQKRRREEKEGVHYVNEQDPNKDTRIKWKDTNYVKAYLLARDGLSDRGIAKAMGITSSTFTKWKGCREAFLNAIVTGRGSLKKDKNTAHTFQDYVYDRLDPRLQGLWDQMHAWEESGDGVGRLEGMLKDEGKKVRQCLFLHALIKSNFNASEACRIVNVTYHTYKKWSLEDEGFHELVDEVLWHQQNFCEAALMSLVDQQDPGAVLFANRTLNRERYDDKLKIETSGTVEHKHLHVIAINDLDLPIEVRKQILIAMRNQEAEGKEDGPKMIEIESKTVKKSPE